MATFQERIGEKIRELRKDKDWTQSDLAQAITDERKRHDADAKEVSIDTIGRVERGENSTTDTLTEVAAAFGMTLAQLVTQTFIATRNGRTVSNGPSFKARAVAENFDKLEPKDQDVLERMIAALVPD